MSDVWSYASDPVHALERMPEVVKQGGTMCMLVMDSVLEHIQSFLDVNQMETTVLHSFRGSDTVPSEEPSIVINKTSLVPYTNGANRVNGAAEPQQVTLVLAANPTEEALAVASKLTAALIMHSCETNLFSWGSNILTLTGKSCISLLEF